MNPNRTAVIRLHEWATGFERKATLYDALQTLGQRHLPFDEGLRAPMHAVMLRRDPPVRALRRVLLDRCTEVGGDGIRVGAIMTSLAYFRSWGHRVDLHAASVVLDALADQMAALQRTLEATHPRDVHDVWTAHTQDRGIVLGMQHLRLIQLWLAEDGAVADSIIITAVLRVCRTVVQIADLLRSARMAMIPGSAEEAGIHTQFLWCMTLAHAAAAAALKDMTASEGRPSRAALSLYIKIAIRAGKIANADDALMVFAAQPGDGESGADAAPIRLKHALVQAAASANHPRFPAIFARWGSPTLLSSVALWYTAGKGRPCPHCGDPANHTAASTAVGGSARACATVRSGATVVHARTSIFEQRPDNENHYVEAMAIIDSAAAAGVVEKLKLPVLLRMATKAPPADFDRLLARLLELVAAHPHGEKDGPRAPHFNPLEKFFHTRVLHYMFHARDAELAKFLGQYCDKHRAIRGDHYFAAQEAVSRVRGDALREELLRRLGMLDRRQAR